MTPGTIALEEVTRFKGANVQLTSGGAFNMYKKLQKIVNYTNSQYNTLSDPSALFYNISNQRIPLYAKSIDVNTKDFYVSSVGDTSWFKQWAINTRYRKWAREDGFAMILNETSDSVSTFGSSVWKKVKRGGDTTLEEVDLQNLYFDPTVRNIIDTPVVELHYLTESQILSKYPERGEEAILKAKEARDEEGNTSETETKKYQVWERHGDFEGAYMHFIGAGSGDSEVILFEEELTISKKTNLPEKFPYYDFHGERRKGIWLGLGVVERLMPLQRQVNKFVNQDDEASEIASLLLFRTEDLNNSGNITEQLSSGDIINSADMQQLPISNREFSQFIAKLREYEQKADKLCYIQESISGERPPSGVPFRSLAMASRGAVSTFDYIKQGIVEKMGNILMKEIFPELVAKFNKEDVLDIDENDSNILLYEDMVVDEAKKAYRKQRVKNGLVIWEEDLAKIEARVRKDLLHNKKRKIGKGFFNFEYSIIMNPSNENMDKNERNATYDAAINQVIAAPAVSNIPLFRDKLLLNNIAPHRITPEQQQAMEKTSGKVPNPEAPQDNLTKLAAV